MQKACSVCLVIKILSDFHNQARGHLRHQAVCKACRSNIDERYRSSFAGFFAHLLCTAKSSARDRQKNGRQDAGCFELGYEDLMEMWSKQQGQCYYSHLPMVTQPNSEWQASLERLHQTKGYTLENCVLCCLEFNHFRQWSPAKMRILVQKTPAAVFPHDFSQQLKRAYKRPRGVMSVIDGRRHKRCRVCDTTKDASLFNGLKYVCNSCRVLDQHSRDQTARGHMKCLFRDAKKNTKVRNIKGRAMSFDIDLQYLFELYHQQAGRCAYSDMPMTVGARQNKDWVMSLERINTCVGYVKGNVCLICHEFNTAARYWSRSKVDMVKMSVVTFIEKTQQGHLVATANM